MMSDLSNSFLKTSVSLWKYRLYDAMTQPTILVLEIKTSLFSKAFSCLYKGTPFTYLAVMIEETKEAVAIDLGKGSTGALALTMDTSHLLLSLAV